MLNVGKVLTNIVESMTSSRVAFNTSTYLYRAPSLTKCGKIIILSIAQLTNLPYGQDITLFTLPEGYRPMAQVVADTVAATAAPEHIVRITVNMDGTVVAHSYTTNTGVLNVRVNITYMTP